MNYDIIDTIVRTAIDAIRNAYVEHGSIATGSCLLASDGTLYSGCAIDSVVPEFKLLKRFRKANANSTPFQLSPTLTARIFPTS